MQGVRIVCKYPRRKVGGRLAVTFADKIYDVAETETTHFTGELNCSPKKNKIVFKKLRKDSWRTVKGNRYYARLGLNNYI